MRIAFDIRPLQTQSAHRGIGTYVRELLSHLRQLPEGHEICPLLWNGLPVPPEAESLPHKLYLPSTSPDIANRYLGWLREGYMRQSEFAKLAHEADIFHFTSPFELNMGWPYADLGIPRLVTIHDLMPISHPSIVLPGKLSLFRPLFRWQAHNLQRANGLISVSEYTLNTYRNLVSSKTPARVVTSASSEAFRPCSVAAQTAYRQEHNLPEKYLLYVGGLSPNKNLLRLVEATYQQDFPPLVVCGPDPAQRKAEILQRFPQAKIIWFGYASPQDLPLLYASAHVFVFPSLLEGFGLPVLEAMSCGTPTICSNSTSLPEVCGPTGLTFSPYDHLAIRQTLARVLGDPQLRHDLSQHGLQRAREFSWQRTAQETAQCYTHFLEQYRQCHP